MEVKEFVVTDSLPHDKLHCLENLNQISPYTNCKGICKRATIELKKLVVHLKQRSTEITQTCVNMVRVAGFLTEKALAKGQIVEEITIFGLMPALIVYHYNIIHAYMKVHPLQEVMRSYLMKCCVSC